MQEGLDTGSEVTQLLSALEQGEAAAAEQLLPLVYGELRQLAAAKMAAERPEHTLQPTALVHEAYLRLVGDDRPAKRWHSRGHFFAAAAEAMRRILIENARRKRRLKHGGEHARIAMHDVPVPAVHSCEDLLALDEAITALANSDPRAAELVKLRCFVGLSVEEAAAALAVPPRTAYRDWSFARVWLYRRLCDDVPESPGQT